MTATETDEKRYRPTLTGEELTTMLCALDCRIEACRLTASECRELGPDDEMDRIAANWDARAEQAEALRDRLRDVRPA